MAKIKLHGNPTSTNGDLPPVGQAAPDFSLTNAELADVSLKDFKGKKKLLNIVPSLDTPTCALSTKKFNETAASRDDTVILVISGDLPFAQKRFCDAESTDAVKTLSMMRNRKFAKDYGVLIVDGPLAGVTARAVVVIDENDQLVYSEMVNEIGDEPDYEAAIAALN